MNFHCIHAGGSCEISKTKHTLKVGEGSKKKYRSKKEAPSMESTTDYCGISALCYRNQFTTLIKT